MSFTVYMYISVIQCYQSRGISLAAVSPLSYSMSFIVFMYISVYECYRTHFLCGRIMQASIKAKKTSADVIRKSASHVTFLSNQALLKYSSFKLLSAVSLNPSNCNDLKHSHFMRVRNMNSDCFLKLEIFMKKRLSCN